jgi:hypothetical protein
LIITADTTNRISSEGADGVYTLGSKVGRKKRESNLKKYHARMKYGIYREDNSQRSKV